MDVEILGVLRGARGPGQDMILAQLHGNKPEYTGVVAGMSGSPVYVGNRLLGSLSYRIGQFSKDPIAGITPIEQMLQVHDLPIEDNAAAGSEIAAARPPAPTGAMNFQAMETPLVMSGFRPEAIKLWQQQMAGTGPRYSRRRRHRRLCPALVDPKTFRSRPRGNSIVPGSAVSAQLVRGDVEIAATCTVTYVDPKQLLACGHPLLQAGHRLAAHDHDRSGRHPGLATQRVQDRQHRRADRELYRRPRLGDSRRASATMPHMIPVHITVHSPLKDRKLNVEILDLPSLTPQAMLVSLYEVLTADQRERSATPATTSPATSTLPGVSTSPLNEWASAGDSGSAPLDTGFAGGFALRAHLLELGAARRDPQHRSARG